MKHNTLAILPRELERVRADVSSRRDGLRFGIPALDALLPHGVPRGQVTAMDAPLGSGGTAVLLALAQATLAADEGVALVDAQRTLAPQAAAHLASTGAFWVIRPRGTESAWWCADVLLRTGAFGLVVVDLAPAPSRQVAVRLQRLARDKDAALLVRETAPTWGAAVRVMVRAGPDATISVSMEKGGVPRAVEVPYAASLPHRLRPHWAVRDRRGERPGKRSIGGRGALPQRPRAGTPHWPDPAR